MLIECMVMVPERTAQMLPSRPGLVLEVMREAEKAMLEAASKRRRTLSTPPRLVNTGVARKGAVPLTFQAETRPL
jgi:ribosomal protein RSM22 (predicted rRNA methylase)